MSRKMYAGVAVMLALFVLACGGTSTSGGATVVPATSGSAGATQPSGSSSAAPTQPAVADTPAPAAPAVAKVGDRTELNGTALTVTKVDRAAELGQFNKAKDGNEFVVAEVVIENTGADKIPYNPLYFKVKDADGFETDAELIAGDQSLKSGELAKGEKARGNVAFEVKKGTKGLVMEYKPLVIGSSDAIKVALD